MSGKDRISGVNTGYVGILAAPPLLQRHETYSYGVDLVSSGIGLINQNKESVLGGKNILTNIMPRMT